MATLTRARTQTSMPIPADIPTVEYPEEVVERWDKEFEIARLQFATGEIYPKTAAEMAAEWGIKLD